MISLRLSNPQAAALLVLLSEPTSVRRAVAQSAGGPVPQEGELRSALAALDPGPVDDLEPLTALEASAPTAEEKKLARYARDQASVHFARSGKLPVRHDRSQVGQAEADIALKVVRRTGLSFDRVIAALRR